MIRFESGEKYGLIYSAYPRAGTGAGYVEIISVERKPEEEVIFKNTSIRDCFIAEVGTITFVVYSDTTNTKKKKAVVFCSRNSESYAEEFSGGVREYEWFSPTKRSYYPISSREGKIE